ncbi:MAG: hypothetical protein EZS28_024373 [Streblomastix strix]|uniref:non-specific serine/threonine protein kinase n=1 Tax=Streblomastix strix TaxID=222440 RepID=A0A5J4VC42_9EUKA|nr:MAG: hypothetical protein EZS28_024373 [Streblomastix strix]
MKPENVLLTKDYYVKLADFGLSRMLEQGQTAALLIGGTLYYFAPEVLEGQKDDQTVEKEEKKDDQTVEKEEKKDDQTEKEKKTKNGEEKLPFELMRSIIKDEPEELSDRFPKNLRDLIKKMLNKDPRKRITASEILAVPEIAQSLI